MSGGSFSLSVFTRGNDVVIGGSGSLDVIGVATLRNTAEEACAIEGATVHLDLTALTSLDGDAVAGLIEIGARCRDKGVALTFSLSPESLQVLQAAGYDDRLLPIEG